MVQEMEYVLVGKWLKTVEERDTVMDYNPPGLNVP